MKRFWTMALCLALACGLPGCGEGKSPGTLTLTVSGNYAEDFTARGWTTARLTAAAVDAEGRSLPIDGNIVWWIQTADLHDNIVAWNGDRHDGSGLLWGETPFLSLQTGSDGFPRDATVFLTDTVGSRTVTVMARLRIASGDADEEGPTITAQTTFTFGNGPLSLFSAPPRQVASREEAERYCATFRPAAQQGEETTENGLPPATLLQLVSNNRINGYGAALFAGWPGDFEQRHIYSYWARETDKDGDEGRVVNVKDGLALWYDADARGPLAVCVPKNTPAPPAPEVPPGKAALHAEAEEMLLPRHPAGLSPLPDIWKLRCKSLVPAAGDAPLFYGTPPLAEYNNCYAASVATAALEQPIFSEEEIFSFVPSTFPQPVISDPLSPLGTYGEHYYYSVSSLIRKAREGDAGAMLAISRRFPKDSPSRFFWWRLADALTHPGWAYIEENRKKTDPSLQGLLGDPRDMLAMEYPSLDDAIREPVAGAPDRRHFYRALMRECALRGQIFAWKIWAHLYAYNVAGSSIPKGIILDKINPTRGYAMLLAGQRLIQDDDDSRRGYRSSRMDAETIDKRLPHGIPYHAMRYDSRIYFDDALDQDEDQEWQTITARTTFTFGDGPLSLFSAPPRQVASREEAERYCATFRPAAQQGEETTENGLPPATLLQLVSNNRVNGYGTALTAGWPGEDETRHMYSYWARETKKNGNEGRVVNVQDGLALWYDADARGPLAVCVPKNIPAPPAPEMSPEKAALRAEAEEMLLPQRSGELSPLPDIWKLRCKSLVPAAGDAPLFYGTPPLAEYNNCYAASVATAALEQPQFSKDEILSFDPSTFPQPVIAEPLFSLEKYDSRNSIPVLMRKAREGNPAAMLAISRRLPENSPSRFFWWRLADALTRPGWAYGKENGKKTDPSFLGLLGNPRDMLAMEYPSLDDAISEPVAGTPDRRHFYRELMRKCALRGQIFAWEICAHMYACNVAGSTIPKGIILDKPNPTWGYALALAGKRLAEDKDAYRAGYALSRMDRWTVDKRLPQGFPYRWTLYDTWSPTYLEYEFYNEAIGSTESQLKQNAAELGIDLIKGQALATELLAVYRENYQRVLERQRRRRAAMLPEVNRQIDGWLMDMKARNSEWLKKEWPTWPAYGAEWGRRE